MRWSSSANYLFANSSELVQIPVFLSSVYMFCLCRLSEITILLIVLIGLDFSLKMVLRMKMVGNVWFL